jgi:hypothetical protein
MFRKVLLTALLVAVTSAIQAAPARAQQSLNFQLGAFMPRGEDGRVVNDVLVVNRQYLVFDFQDFNAVTVGAEWSMGLGEYFEAAVGAGYYQRSVPAIYDAWVNDDGSEIQQDLRLRIVPITAIARIFPLGTRRAFQPFVGAGLGVYSWQYSETGDFVDFTDNAVYRDRFVATGTSTGPVAVFGARGQLSRSFGLGLEMRMQWGQATLPASDFLSDKLDLGGLSVLSTFHYRF